MTIRIDDEVLARIKAAYEWIPASKLAKVYGLSEGSIRNWCNNCMRAEVKPEPDFEERFIRFMTEK